MKYKEYMGIMSGLMCLASCVIAMEPEPIRGHIFDAVRTGGLDRRPRVVRYVNEIKPGTVDLNMHDDDGSDNTMLHYLAMAPWGRTSSELAEKLIQKGASIDPVNRLGNTPLLSAIQVGHMEFADRLIALGANKVHANEEGKTALHILLGSSEFVLKMNSSIHECKKTFNPQECSDSILNCFSRLTQMQVAPLKHILVDYWAMQSTDRLCRVLQILPGSVSAAIMAARIRSSTISYKDQMDNGTLFHVLSIEALEDLHEELLSEGLLSQGPMALRDTHGNTPLHYAAMQGACLQMLRRLIALGAIRNCVNDSFNKPYQLFSRDSCACGACRAKTDTKERSLAWRETRDLLSYPVLVSNEIAKIYIRKKGLRTVAEIERDAQSS